MKKARYYRARIEYLACLPEVKKLAESGARIQMIYDELKENGKITMSYPSFCRYASGRMPGVEGIVPIRSRKRRKGALVSGAPAAVPAPSQSIRKARSRLPVYKSPDPQTDGDGFPHDKTTDLESMVYGGKGAA